MKLNFNGNRLLLYTIAFILVGAIVFSGVKLYNRFSDYDKAEEFNAQTQKKYTESVSVDSTDKPDKQKPPIKVNFNRLIKDNADIVGWIYCPDTAINYPVVQADDNLTYLETGINNEYLISGTIFTDFRNSEAGIDENYIIYGHNMRNGSMFGTIDNYSSQSYFEKHPYLYFLTPEKNFKIEVFAGKVVPYNDYIYQVNPDSKDYYTHLEEIIKTSDFKSEVKYIRGEKTILLSTCTDNSGRTRYILIGKLTELI